MSGHEDPRAELAALVHAAARHVRRRAYLGERAAEAPATPEPAPAAAPAPRARPARRPAPEPPPGAMFEDAPPAEAPPTAAVAAGCATLAELREAVAACRACALCETRTQTVFSDGGEDARVLFVGEAPGQREDEQGVPFVGPAGQLLTAIVEKGMGLPRSAAYIANVLKCRPPSNRDPEPREKELCTPFLDRQIELVDPGIVIALGRHAAHHLLRTDLSMGRLRGRVHRRDGRAVVVTYHPAYLLRSPGMKKDCWQDIQLAMKEIGLAKPSGQARTP